MSLLTRWNVTRARSCSKEVISILSTCVVVTTLSFLVRLDFWRSKVKNMDQYSEGWSNTTCRFWTEESVFLVITRKCSCCCKPSAEISSRTLQECGSDSESILKMKSSTITNCPDRTTSVSRSFQNSQNNSAHVSPFEELGMTCKSYVCKPLDENTQSSWKIQSSVLR